MLRTSLNALLAALLASGAALAQDFETLSPGNQMITRALHDAQPTDAATGEPVEGSLTLDQIAGMKQDGTGWGEIFHQMQADGQIPPDAKNLGQLVSGHYQPPAEPIGPASGAETASNAGAAGTASNAGAGAATRGRSEIVVTTGSGGQVVVGRGHGAGGPKVVTGPGRSGEATAAQGGHGAGGKVTVTTGAGNAVGAAHGGGHAKVEVVTGGGASHGVGHGVHVTTGAGASAAGGGQALGHDKGGGGGRAVGHAR